MQWYAVVVLVVVATVFDHVNARLASGVLVNAELDNEVAERKCPHKAVTDTDVTVPFVMSEKLKDCVRPSVGFKRQIISTRSADAYRRLFRSACAQVPAAKTCVAAVDADAEACLGDVERKMWTTKLDFLDTCMAAICADDGEMVADFFRNEFELIPKNRLRLLSCIVAAAAKGKFGREDDLPAYTLRKYLAVKSGKQCILNVVQTDANQFEHFADQIIGSMKCLTPVTNDIVLCKTL